MHSALAPGLTHIQSLECDDRLILSGLSQDGPGTAQPAFATAFVGADGMGLHRSPAALSGRR
ncbi:MAG TPA: hypothetical protein VGC16_01845 [Rhizomicrobium sp.]